jgi:hypothetical protein
VYLHHVGLLVDHGLWPSQLLKGLGYDALAEPVEDYEQQATIQLYDARDGPVYMEAIQASDSNSHLAGKKAGLHHLCFCSDEFDLDAEWLRQAGFVPVRRPSMAVAFGERLVSWWASGNGLLIELLEG